MQSKFAEYYIMINNCTVECYEHTNAIKEKVLLNTLISLRNGFVLETNILISIFKWIRKEYSSVHIE